MLSASFCTPITTSMILVTLYYYRLLLTLIVDRLMQIVSIKQSIYAEKKNENCLPKKSGLKKNWPGTNLIFTWQNIADNNSLTMWNKYK